MVGATSRVHSLRTKCHMEQSATPHGGGHLLKPMGATSWICRAITVMFIYSRKLIIFNKLQLVWGMGGSDGCRNDILLMAWEYGTWLLLRTSISIDDILLIAWEYVTWLLLRTSIRRDISSPSTSVNNPRLAYIWMYVCWGAHLDTYLDIWVRRVIIISVPVILLYALGLR